MKPILSYILCVAVIGSVETATANNITILDTFNDTFQNPDCSTSSCTLKSLNFQVQQEQVNLDAYDTPSFITEMRTSYDTSSVDELRNYGLAQQIKGCMYSSQVVNGKVVLRNDIQHYLLHGAKGPFVIPQWNNDDYNLDPLDWSGLFKEPKDRHMGYRWNDIPGSFDERTQHFVKEGLPKTPSLYVHDIVGSAFDSPKQAFAQNIALEFNICVYKSSDVTKDIPLEKTDFAKPLKCFNWSSVYVYNHHAKKFETPTLSVDEICAQVPPPPKTSIKSRVKKSWF